MVEKTPAKTVYRHIKTIIHLNIFLILVFSFLLFTRLFWLGVVIEIALVVALIRAVIVDLTEYIVLEDHSACVHTGLFFVRNNRVPYTKMNNIDITNFFGFHNLEIDAGNDVSEIKFRWIEDANMLKAALDEKLMINNYYQNSKKNENNQQPQDNPQNYSQTSQRQQSQNPQVPHLQTHQEHMEKCIQELNQLAYLRSKGVITAEEFEMQKRKILAD
jgi:uncharacterized membrane protein YdbT with pleckstrin-like domain